jgi:hypothetical protein
MTPYFGNAVVYFNSELQLFRVEDGVKFGPDLQKIVTMLYIAGWSARQAAVLEFWKRRTVAAAGESDPELPPLKPFTAKISLPAISDYSTTADDQFWDKFPSNKNTSGKSTVSPVRLRSWANAVGCADRDRLQAVCKDLENGADIGCRGPARDPTHSTNASSAIEYGAQVTDAIATWVKQGLVAGPFNTADRP